MRSRIQECMYFDFLDEETAIAKLALNSTWKWLLDLSSERSNRAWKAEFINSLDKWSRCASSPYVRSRAFRRAQYLENLPPWETELWNYWTSLIAWECEQSWTQPSPGEFFQARSPYSCLGVLSRGRSAFSDAP